MIHEEMVSIVIPCRNEVRNIGATIKALQNSEHQNFEILVVDGMSEDGTRALLGDIMDADPRVKMIDNVKRLTPFAFNLGVKNAQGDYVQIVGARNELDPGYMTILLDELKKRPEVACVGGDFQHIYDTDEGRYIGIAMESPFGMGIGNYRTLQENSYVDTVGIPMYRRSIFKEVGYFDETLTRNQDDEFNFRLRQRGMKILYVHQAKATYLVRSSYKKAFWQFFQYGYFKVFVNRKHRAVTTVRQVVPAAFLAFWALGLPLSLFWPPLRPLLSGVAFVYIFGGLLMIGGNLSLKDRFRTFLICFMLHVAYGSGYWAGIWDFLLIHRLPREEFQRQTL